MKPYLYNEGIKELAQEISGKENIYLGIRPYGFHAGNMLPHIVYPILLGEELQKRGIEPEFNIFVFINDWEQDGLTGPDTKNYPFNVYPKNSTFQFVTEPNNKGRNIVDYWEPKIYSKINEIKKRFPKVKITTIRNSSMKKHPIMKKHLLQTISSPNIMAQILKKYTGKALLDKPICYAMAVCPYCKKVKGQSRVNGDIISHECENCGRISQGHYSEFEYWFYHKALAIPRLEIFDIDICITGADHYNEGDYIVRQKLIEAYRSKAKFPKTLYTQIVLGRDGKIMGKSRGNTELVELNKLVDLIKTSPDKKTIQIV